MSELETRFYSSSQKHNQKPSDFVYDLLKIHKILKLEMTEEKLINHIISRLEPQILDYVEVRNPQTTSNLLQIIDKYEERFLSRKIRVSSWESRNIKPNEKNRFPNRNRQENWRETRGNNRYAGNSRPRREFNRFESQGIADNQRFNDRRRGGQSDNRFHNQGGSRNSPFRGDIHNSPLGHGAEKSFISEEDYRKYFSYRPRQKTTDKVTAQGAPCCHLGRVELQIRIREFQKTWEFHILNDMQYQYILGIDFMKKSKLTLDFDQKLLIIPDNQIKQLQKMDKAVEIDLSNTKLGEGQKQKLRNLFNGFKGLFSAQPELTHVLYHDIDTGDMGPVVSRPYRYDKIRPIQFPYASPVVLTRKNNGIPPDSPEAYRFAIDYRKLNAITKYFRYPLPVIDDLITNIPHTGVMSTLDLKSGYFQLAISPKDTEKTVFITRNGGFAFLRMPFGLLGAAPNFQQAIDIILKPVIGRFVSVYMDDVIITSPSFNEHLDHLNQVFTLLRDAGLTLNKDKCHFASDKLKYLGIVISKEGIETDNSKVKVITEMKPPKNIREVSKFLGMAGWYQKFIPKNPVGNIDGSQISSAALRALASNSREQLIREQRENPEL
ncbi:retrovirus-related Pol polyprotein from transposon 297 [Trichonephila clavipes]|nr:retrovirus-related Pol polyprotein from transposon 297 [Trichonephila clavipes]